MKKVFYTIIIAIIITVIAIFNSVDVFAAERIEPGFTMTSDMVAIAAEVLHDGDAYIDSSGSSVSDKVSLLKLIQSYVDSVTALSQTPTVKGVISNNGKSNEQVKLTLVYSEDDFTDEEVLALQSKAGTTVESINNFLISELSYEFNTEDLSLSSDPATAKGALSTGKAICMGYSNAFSVLAERAGIRFVKVRGYVNDGYHVMNVVEGGFAVDVTWNDSGDNRFLMIPFDEYCTSTGFQPEINVNAAFELKYG